MGLLFVIVVSIIVSSYTERHRATQRQAGAIDLTTVSLFIWFVGVRGTAHHRCRCMLRDRLMFVTKRRWGPLTFELSYRNVFVGEKFTIARCFKGKGLNSLQLAWWTFETLYFLLCEQMHSFWVPIAVARRSLSCSYQLLSLTWWTIIGVISVAMNVSPHLKACWSAFYVR